MAEMIEKFDVLHNLEKKEKESIKLFYIFNNLSEKHPYHINGTNVIIVTDKDETKVLGENSNGCLGVTEKQVKTFTILGQLSGKKLISFSNGSYHVVARSSTYNIYCWGFNNTGQMGNGTNGNHSKTPEMNEFLSTKCIVDVCCGDWHSLALTSTGEVYAWGDNQLGQIGNGSSKTMESTPVKLVFGGHSIIAISCGSLHSMVLTEKGLVFAWGYNNYGQLGVGNTLDMSKPKLIEMNLSFKKMSCGQKHSLLLTTDGLLYVFGKTYLSYRGSKKIPMNINYSEKFTEIASNKSYSFSVVQSAENKCLIFGKFDNKKITSLTLKPYASIIDYYAKEWNITSGTIIVKEDFNQVSEINSSKNSQFVNAIQDKEISNKTTHSISIDGKSTNEKSRFVDDFEETECIGKGGFGSVYKVKNKLDDRYYAVKKITFEGMPVKEKGLCLNELKLLAKIESEFVVQYKSSWIESDIYLYIQMELCSYTLKEAIFKKQTEFNRELHKAMNPTEYYISNELFKEILEGINYLHKLDPPIIHRDLKPQNILITTGINGRFTKIADFGLATFHDSNDRTHTANLGTDKYCAPEVKSGRNYNTKADIYSLGILAMDLFDVDIYTSSSLKVVENTVMKEKFECIIEWIRAMNSQISDTRPSCSKLIKNKDSWSFSNEVLKNDAQFLKFTNESQKVETIDENFIQYFFKKKLD